jgi:hypothetical protein
MATKITKPSKKPVQTDSMIMPDLVCRDPDTKYTGGEPLFSSQPDQDRRAGAMAAAFNWYSRYFDRKMAKEQLALYLENLPADGKTDTSTLSKQIRKVDDKEIMATYGWLARLSMRGLKLDEVESQRLSNEIARLVNTLHKPVVVETPKAEEVKPARPNIQEIMRDKARDAAGTLEGELDEFILAGAKASGMSVNAVGVLSGHNIMPQHISMLSDVWQKKLNEFNEVLAGTDAQLNQAYGHYSKHQIKAVIKFIEAVLAGFDSYINVKKASKSPRKRKPVSAEKQASKVKFLKQFEELKLVSVHPAKIVGASEVWAYDTVKRKLHYYLADSHVGTLGVKGSTILGFDASKSGVKTVRKPAEVLKKILAAGKPATRKLFGEINAVHAQPNGRTNENLIILKVY